MWRFDATSGRGNTAVESEDAKEQIKALLRCPHQMVLTFKSGVRTELTDLVKWVVSSVA